MKSENEKKRKREKFNWFVHTRSAIEQTCYLQLKNMKYKPIIHIFSI